MNTQTWATIKDDQEPQGAISIPHSEGPLGSTYPTPQCSEILDSESDPAVEERHNSIPGAPVEITAVSISASNSDILTHEYAALAISGGSNSILNTPIYIGASEPNNQKDSLKGRVQFYLVLQVCHSHRNLEVSQVGFLPLGRNIHASNSDNVGSSDLCRFEHTSDQQDIDHAISHHQREVEYTPSGHSDHASYLSNLGISYAHHFIYAGHR